MDAIKLLTQDHKAVDSLFKELENTKDPKKQRKLVDTVIEELSIHAAIEEKELYPVMREAFSDNDLVEHAEHEHAKAKTLLIVLSQLPPEHDRFAPILHELISDVRHHVKEEENDLFPKLKDKIGDQELEILGGRLQHAKKNAPTKPSSGALEALNKEELYEFGQKLGIEGRSTMDKDELIAEMKQL